MSVEIVETSIDWLNNGGQVAGMLMKYAYILFGFHVIVVFVEQR